jgi:hypothetical protein
MSAQRRQQGVRQCVELSPSVVMIQGHNAKGPGGAGHILVDVVPSVWRAGVLLSTTPRSGGEADEPTRQSCPTC